MSCPMKTCFSLLLGFTVVAGGWLYAQPGVTDIGSRRELFVDGALMAR
jgi:hypothetical protein